MAVIANRRSVMTLFSTPTDVWSHRVRLVLAEKSLNIDIVDVDDENFPEDLLDLNPYTMKIFPKICWISIPTTAFLLW